MLKTDLVEIANIRCRNNKAALYSAKVKTRRRFKSNLFSIILGCVLGFIVGMFYIMSVSASDVKFTNSEWIDICYISRMVEAEAGNQTELGRRFATDTVLNRLKDGRFGKDIESIVLDETQYAKGITATQDTIRIVMEEYRKQTNTEVLYFRTEKYHDFGTRLFVEDDHYFSK